MALAFHVCSCQLAEASPPAHSAMKHLQSWHFTNVKSSVISPLASSSCNSRREVSSISEMGETKVQSEWLGKHQLKGRCVLNHFLSLNCISWTKQLTCKSLMCVCTGIGVVSGSEWCAGRQPLNLSDCKRQRCICLLSSFITFLVYRRLSENCVSQVV